MSERASLKVGDRVGKKDDASASGTVSHVYSQDFANLTDRDVQVTWDGVGPVRRTNETAADLERL